MKGIFFTITSALLFGVTPILSSTTFAMGSNAATLTFFRSLFVLPVLLSILLYQKIDFKLTKQQLQQIMLLGSLGTTAATLLMCSAYHYIDVGTATVLHFLYPVFVALFCWLFYKERLSTIKWIALVIACLGITFFCNTEGQVKWMGIILAVVSGVNYAYYMVEVDKKGLKSMNPFKLSFYLAIVGCFTMLIYNGFTDEIIWQLSGLTYVYTLIIALCTSFLAVVLLQLGIKYLGATTAAIFCMFEPIASVFAGWLFLGEALSLAKILGSIIIISAVTLLVASGKLTEQPVLEPTQAKSI